MSRKPTRHCVRFAVRCSLFIWLVFVADTLKASDTAQIGAINKRVYQLLNEHAGDEARASFDSLSPKQIIDAPQRQQLAYHLNRAYLLYEEKRSLPAIDVIDSLLNQEGASRSPFLCLKALTLKIRCLRSLRKVGDTYEIADSMIAQGKRISNHKFMGIAHYYKARAFEDQGKFSEAITRYEIAVRQFTMVENQKMLAIVYKSLGIVYRKMGVYSKAIENYLGALNAYARMNNDKGVASVYNSMGILAATNEDFDNGIAYLRKALKYQEKTPEEDGIAPNIYNNLGVCYLGKEDYDSAALVLTTGLEISERIRNTREVSIAVNNLGIAYKGLGDYNKSKRYYYKAIALKKAINRTSSLPVTYLGLGHAHFLEGNLDSAKYYYGLIEPQIPGSSPKFKTEVYAKLAEYHQRVGSYQQAFLALDSFRRFSEVLHGEQKEELAHNYESLFNLKASELENTKLQSALNQGALEARIANETARVRGILFSLSLIVLGLVLIAIVRILMDRKKLRRSNESLERVNRQLEESLEENKGIMSIVAHDLRSPLMQIKGLLDILKDESNLGEEQLSYLHTIDRVYDNSLSLINDLTTAHKTEKREVVLAPTNLSSMVGEAVERFKGQASTKEIDLVLNAQHDKIKVESSSEHLSRILDNLISNAIKFSPKKKSVRIDLMDSDEHAVVSVNDEGPGISEKEQERLFRRFEKLSNQPTAGEASSGLGLYIVKSLADEIDAKVTVNSVKGAGSRFSVVLPK